MTLMFCVEEELRQSTLAQTGKLESDTLADLEDSELFEMDQMTRLGKCDRPSGTPPKSPNQCHGNFGFNGLDDGAVR